MKKIISVFLAALMLFGGLIPIASAETVTPPAGTVHVRLVLPSSEFYGAYDYIATKNGESVVYPDPTGDYVFYEKENRFIRLDDVIFEDERAEFAKLPRYAGASIGDYEAVQNFDGLFICPNNGAGIPGDDRNFILAVDGKKYYYEPYLELSEENKDMYADESHYSIRQYKTYEAYPCATAGYVQYEPDTNDTAEMEAIADVKVIKAPIHGNQSEQEFSFYHYDSLPEISKAKCPLDRYEIFAYRNATVTEPTDFVFHMVTDSVYDATTAYLYVGGKRTEPTVNGECCKVTGGERYQYNALGEYVVRIDPTKATPENNIIYLYIVEKDEFGNRILLKNSYPVVLPSGEGFICKPIVLENGKFVTSPNYYVTYGEDFYFRVKIKKKYTGVGMTVKCTAENPVSNDDEILGELSALTDLLAKLTGEGQGENLCTPVGTDEEGCQVFKISKVTKNCTIEVDGVQEEETAGILAIVKRIVIMICDLFHIEVPSILQNLLGISVTPYRVTFDTSCDVARGDGVTYQILNPSAETVVNDLGETELIFRGAETLMLKVTKKSATQKVNVQWGEYVAENENGEPVLKWVQTPESETVQVQWKAHQDPIDDTFEYVATYYINIDKDQRVIIKIS